MSDVDEQQPAGPWPSGVAQLLYTLSAGMLLCALVGLGLSLII
jgi:hypothetical protein